ncbi:MAG: hypothetical protein HXX14_10890 [Bacteroidetes bacterium]|nr:hypothetical protein [Bacteroidota bacterium]
MSFAEKSSFGAIQVVSGLIIILIGLFALTGWLLHIPVLSSIRSDFIPMAPATAIVFTLYGLFFMNSTYLLSKGYEKQLVILVSILSLYCSLQFIEYFLNVDLTFDTILFPSTTRLKNFAVNQMSPYTGLLFFLSGVTVLLKLKSRNSDSVLKIVSASGCLSRLLHL